MNPFRDRIRAGERVIACPKCASTLPAASVAVLRNWVIRGTELVSIKTGDRVICQQCGHCYSIGPLGTFAHFEPQETLRPRGNPPPVLTRDGDRPEPSMRMPALKQPPPV